MMSKIGDVMTRQVITVPSGSSVMEAVSLMAKRSISCVIVVDKTYRPVGIVTERDMVKRVLNNVLDPRRVKVDDIMTSPVMTLSADQRITDAINMMQKFHFRRIVVATDKSKLLGILTQSDLLMEIHKVQLELEEMNENLRNTIVSIRRYNESTKPSAEIKSLRSKIRAMQKSLERAQKRVDGQVKRVAGG